MKVEFLKKIREKKASLTPKTSKYIEFQKKYYHDPCAFVRDVLFSNTMLSGATLYQEEILKALMEHERVAVRGPRGLGKTSYASWLVLWFALTRDGEDWKVPTTASVWRQLTKFLWPEIRKWSRKINWGIVGRNPFNERTEMLQMNLRLNTGEAFALASDDPLAMEGAHADHILYVFDEAKNIDDGIWDSAEGSLTGGEKSAKPAEAYAVAISTPGEPVGRFYDIHMHKAGLEDWWTRHVTQREALSAGRMDPVWAEQRRLQWGEDSALYKTQVLGEFSEAGADGIIPLSWIDAAIERWHAWVEAGKEGRITCISADIGGGGSDSDATVIARVFNEVIIDELEKMPESNNMTATMEVAGRIASILPNYNTLAIIDVTGIGAGVLHRLREMRLTAWGFAAARKTELRDKAGELGFINQRAAAWWITRELFDPANEIPIAIPPDDELIGDLTAPKWKIHSNGKIQIEAKDSIRRRLHRSTDCGDAVVMALVGPILMDEEREQETEVYEDMSVEIGDY
jgi:hypothetical protein